MAHLMKHTKASCGHLKQELEGIQAQIRGIQANYDKYAAMEALPAFMKLLAVKEAYRKSRIKNVDLEK